MLSLEKSEKDQEAMSLIAPRDSHVGSGISGKVEIQSYNILQSPSQ